MLEPDGESVAGAACDGGRTSRIPHVRWRQPSAPVSAELWSKVVYGWVETCGVSLLKSSCERHGFGKRSTPHMSNDTVVSLAAPALVPDPLTELLRSGARRLVEAAVRAELEEHLPAFGHEKLPDGRQRVVRNGRLRRALELASQLPGRATCPHQLHHLAPAAWLPTPRQGHRGSPVQRRHRGHRGPQSRRMNNPSYTRFDNSSSE